MNKEIPYIYKEIYRILKIAMNDYNNQMTFNDFRSNLSGFRINKDNCKHIMKELVKFGLIEKDRHKIMIKETKIIRIGDQLDIRIIEI